MLRILGTVLLVFATISLVTCQTFQYSRGWTNGKRAENSAMTNILDFKSPTPSLNHLSSLQARCATLHKWKLFLRPNDNEEVCRVPCEFLDVLRQCLQQQQQQQQQQQRPDKAGTVFRRSSETSSTIY